MKDATQGKDGSPVRCPECGQATMNDSVHIGGRGYVTVRVCAGTRKWTTAADGVMDPECSWVSTREQKGKR